MQFSCVIFGVCQVTSLTTTKKWEWNAGTRRAEIELKRQANSLFHSSSYETVQ